MATLPIPKLYWDVFQGAFQTKIKRLAKEIASSLGQPEQPLLKALVAEKVDVYLFEEEGSEFIDLPSMRCKHQIMSSENLSVLKTCDQPVLLGKQACLLHELKAEGPPPPLPKLRIVKDLDTGNSFWVNSENAVLDKASLSAVGHYDETAGQIRIFNVTSGS
jgi:hypothetical protein